MIFQRDFYLQNPMNVAHELVGAWLCREMPDGEFIRAQICELELYLENDRACHAFGGRCTARIENLDGAAQDIKEGKKERIINGHQIIAVHDAGGRLRAFDPGQKELKYIKPEIKVGNIIKFRFDGEIIPHTITAILTPQEFAKVNTYKKLRDLYVYGSGNKKQDFKKGKNKLTFWENLQNYFVKQND